jgi:hypothetical protein
VLKILSVQKNTSKITLQNLNEEATDSSRQGLKMATIKIPNFCVSLSSVLSHLQSMEETRTRKAERGDSSHFSS